MKRNTRTIAAAAVLALAAAGAGLWALLSLGGADSTTTKASVARGPRSDQVSRQATAGPNAPSSSARASRDDSAGRQLKLPHRGQPIVLLRRSAKVPVRTSPGGRVVKEMRWQTQFGSRTVFAVFRHRGRWVGVPTPLLPNGQLGWVKLDPSRLRVSWTRYAIDIDLSARSAELRVGSRVLRSFSVTIGASSSPTPTGWFAITDTFRGHLSPAYGCCALATTATQENLPSGWLGGNLIAIHGTTGPLGVAASHGCVRAPNRDVSALVNRVGLGTPVVVHG
jgi:L,D-transpeptidase-like protein